MKTINFLLLCTAALIVACNSNDDKLEEKEYSLVISMGTQCGWCGGTDSLNINSDDMHYETNNPCNNPTIKIDKSINQQDWDELTGTLNWDDFKSIDINTCYYCADGCDTWIAISKNGDYHRIQFGYPDSLVVEKIKPMIDKLNEIKTSIISR